MGIFSSKGNRSSGGGGGKKKVKAADAHIDQHDKAVYDLKIQRDRLNKYIANSRIVAEKEIQIARRLMKEGKKDRAKLALQKKKFQENLISQTEAKILNIEELLNSVEYAKVQQEVFNALKEGNNALQKINSQMSIEEVEKLMDDTAEAIAYQEEISRILGTELTDADNDAVLEELEMIEKGELVDLKTQLPEVKKSPVTLQPAKQVKEKEKEEKEDVIEEEEREVVLA